MTPDQVRPTSDAESAQRIEELIELIDALIDVIAAENTALAIGLPASQSRHTEVKTRLADYFELWVGEVSARRLRLPANNAALQAKFTARIECLRQSMDENLIRLRAAIEASQHRIEMVMSAIREQMAGTSPYGAGGRVVQRSASSGTNIRA
ncbi:flagellar protein FlgN [Rhodopseudomonas sp. WA056]|uniref:flagellar protein FlgN n=1 Tax=Rhodopseudomonas sp. WA056 TaxID=2269367 RepID=UPI0013DF808D|nr:flagellar protein FlgN [Rhodopseudomonas sp. WA056]NEW87053.1 flagellar protein FlgN [Rhodopseudomonas sp. WA056]